MSLFRNSNNNFCAFCGRPADTDRKLAASKIGEIFICRECAELCSRVLAEEDNVLLICKKSDSSSLVKKYVK